MTEDTEAIARHRACAAEKEQERLKEVAIQEQKEVASLAQMRRTGKTVNQQRVQQYNARVQTVVADTDTRIRLLLGSRYGAFREWLRRNWEELSEAPGKARLKAGKADVSTCYVYATQYNGYTDVEVALPDKYVKFANKGYDSPYDNSPYTVNITRDGQSTGNVVVEEVGPWNVDDNYWNAADGSVPRRLFKDLDLCQPEAEAAYFNGYNNGEDQFGRTVANPAGVDLTPTVASWIGLDYLQNDWVTVNYEDLPGGDGNGRIIIDSNDNNNGSNADVVPPESWNTGSYGDYYGTGYYWHQDESTSDPVTFRFYLETAQRKTVYAWWTEGDNRNPKAPYIAYDSNGDKLGVIYEDQRYNGGQWDGVGTWDFTAGWNEVKVSHWTSGEGVIIADAVMVE